VAVFVLGVAIVVGLVAGRAGAAQATTNVYVFSTATSQFYPPGNNQGWWGEAGGITGTNVNDNYYVGWGANNKRYNDYFTFDIGSFTNPCVPQSAYLTVKRGLGGGGAPTVTYSLHDVSTFPLTLAQKANGPNQTIYNDLGSGTSYGSYVLPTAGGSPFTLNLNANGLNAIHLYEQAHAQFFSVGGSLGSPPAGQFLFASTGGGGSAVTLTVVIPKLCKVS
jgi:hypothetical protein